ncbi:hypothetical protein HPB52_018956 [Rhipicephalus sanguineus]|uniref:Uncharacterized protein n=1 Tax=Rhipicephalus sanguineus TaxID=34632 RepID=A0A9D4PMZ6_RHISA|nr:hypothetical protein HPB52_018956 [Rhipicephalus sanguineus]
MDVVHPSYVSAKDFTGECAWIRQDDNCAATDSESKRRQQRALQVSAKYPSGQWLLTLVHRDNDTPTEELL